MEVSNAKKHEVWDHFMSMWAVDKIGGGHGVTGARLRYIKPVIWRDVNFWFDIVHRHDLADHTPRELMASDPVLYDHCLGNFWGMVYQGLVERGKIKPGV